MPVYTVVLYAWHLDFMFVGALRHDLVHALQHESFVLASILVWWSAIEPQRRRLRGELWKVGYIFAARMPSMFLAMAFAAIRTPIYAGYYGDRPRALGLSPLSDQQLAGGLMFSVDIVIMMVALAAFFLRAAEEDERAARLSERGARSP